MGIKAAKAFRQIPSGSFDLCRALELFKHVESKRFGSFQVRDLVFRVQGLAALYFVQ